MTTIESASSRMGPWPSDIIDQREFIARLEEWMNDLYTYVNEHAADVVTIEDTSEPNQAAWESAYTTQTGKSLPIPPNAILIWYDTTNLRLGGLYGTTASDSTVINRGPRNAPGQIIYLGYDNDATSQTIATKVGESFVGMPSLTFTLPVKCRLEIYASAYITIASGSGPFGIEIYLDGVKVGTEYFGIPEDLALFQSSVAEFLNGRVMIEDVDVGPHTVEMSIGFSGAQSTPVQVTVGGNSSAGNGYISLVVKGVVQ